MKDHIHKCLGAGIQRPIGMCIQDASWSHGWDKGPWLGQDTTGYYTPATYETWRNYIQDCSVGTAQDDRHFSQEDVLGGLIWGTQVVQRLAGEVQVTENAIVCAKKMATYVRSYKGMEWPTERIDEGWCTLLLSQHHDCWTVPYNQLQRKKTWAKTVTDQTGVTIQNSHQIVDNALFLLRKKEGEPTMYVYNTLATDRDELVMVRVPVSQKNSDWTVPDKRGKKQPVRWLTGDGVSRLLFRAQVPSAGYASYTIRKVEGKRSGTLKVEGQEDGTFRMESDLYILALNPFKGGVIESLRAKAVRGKEFVDNRNKRGFNELRGCSIDEGSFLSSIDQPAEVNVLEQGPLFVKAAVRGKIGEFLFTQTIRLAQGESRIGMNAKLDWIGSPRIGEPDIGFRADNPRKAFYDDHHKLLMYLLTQIANQQIYKDVPFDIYKSWLENTFFSRWNSVKHSIILNRVDVANKDNSYGLSLFTDHTTSYVHGKGFPLALNVQYAGKGLWGRDYIIDRPTEISYTLIPHAGIWEKSRTWTQSERRNEPLVATLDGDVTLISGSPFRIENNAYELASMIYKDNDLCIRLFNAQSDTFLKTITSQGRGVKTNLAESGNRLVKDLTVIERRGTSSTRLSVPRYGIGTLKVGCKDI